MGHHRASSMSVLPYPLHPSHQLSAQTASLLPWIFCVLAQQLCIQHPISNISTIPSLHVSKPSLSPSHSAWICVWYTHFQCCPSWTPSMKIAESLVRALVFLLVPLSPENTSVLYWWDSMSLCRNDSFPKTRFFFTLCCFGARWAEDRKENLVQIFGHF